MTPPDHQPASQSSTITDADGWDWDGLCTLAVGAVSSLLLAYVISYLCLVRRVGYSYSDASRGVVCTQYQPYYLGPGWLGEFYQPLATLDRAVRPRYWKKEIPLKSPIALRSD